MLPPTVAVAALAVLARLRFEVREIASLSVAVLLAVSGSVTPVGGATVAVLVAVVACAWAAPNGASNAHARTSAAATWRTETVELDTQPIP